MSKHTAAVTSERRQKLWTMLTKGMKAYEIAKELNTDHSTISRDIKYLTSQSHNYLNDLAKETLPFMYEQSIAGIGEVLKECWRIYQSEATSINMYQRLAALKLAKECHESTFQLLDEGPSVLALRQLQERLVLIESRQVH
jgi:IS30 family transposase